MYLGICSRGRISLSLSYLPTIRTTLFSKLLKRGFIGVKFKIISLPAKGYLGSKMLLSCWAFSYSERNTLLVSSIYGILFYAKRSKAYLACYIGL